MLLSFALALAATPAPLSPALPQGTIPGIGPVSDTGKGPIISPGGNCAGATPVATPGPAGSGTSNGPGDTTSSSTSPGTSSPTSPGTTAPGPGPGSTYPGGSPGGGIGTPAAEEPSSPLGEIIAEHPWTRWWHYNREEFLLAGPRWSRPVTGPEENYDRGPSPALIHERVAPALRELLERDSSASVIAGSLLALGRIGPASPGDDSTAELLRSYLADSNDAIAEAACISLGVLAQDQTAPTLSALLADTDEGRELVGRRRINDRMRAFAAYGLGLTAQRSPNPDLRRYATATLLRTLEGDEKDRGVRISCAIGLGLSSPDEHGLEGVSPASAPSSSNSELTKRLVDLFESEERDNLVRAHLPTAIGRIAVSASKGVRKAATDALLRALAKRSHERHEIRQSCALALGLLADADLERTDREVREGLMAAAKDGDLTTRHFAMVSLAQIASRAGEDEDEALAASPHIRKFLFARLAKGSSDTRAWAALALGVAGFGLRETDSITRDEAFALRTALQSNRSSERQAALALATGLAGDEAAMEPILEVLDGHSQDDALARYAALGLGFGGSQQAIEPLQELLRGADHHPAILEDTTLALRLLGDDQLVPVLSEMVEGCDCSLSQSSLATALGRTRDGRAVAPLLYMLQKDDGPSAKRTWAAFALGELCDPHELPWQAVIGAGLNYHADEPTLTTQAGDGVLDYP